MSEYYPAGVTDAHPHYNPPKESATAVECGADEALVVPSFAVKAALNELGDYLDLSIKHRPNDQPILSTIRAKVQAIYDSIPLLEQEREYECPFADELDLEESECARWNCPVCGNERETDNLPEDRDPDEERYDYDD
jgi:hypothetical protein